MIRVKPRFQSFEEYLAYDDGTDKLYELFNGGLIEVPPESGKNVQIATFLLIQFAAFIGYHLYFYLAITLRVDFRSAIL